MSRIENVAGSQPNAQLFKPVIAVPPGKERQAARPPSLDEVDSHLVSLVAPESPEAEQYRTLRYEVEYIHKPGKCTAVGICSALPGEGKTVTAINLAGALAQDPKSRVLLVEVDLRRPAVTVGDQLSLGDVAGRGLVDAVMDPSLSLEEVVRHVAHFNLAVLPAGKRSSSPYEVLNSPRFGELLTQARQRYDYLVLDAPPILPVPDCRLISKWVDSMLMVVAAHSTPREALEEALNMIRPAGVLGLVFNGYDRSSGKYYGYGYGYGHPVGRRRSRRWWSRLWK